MGRPMKRPTKLMRVDVDVCEAISYLGRKERKPAKAALRDLVFKEGFAVEDFTEGFKTGVSLGLYKPKKRF